MSKPNLIKINPDYQQQIALQHNSTVVIRRDRLALKSTKSTIIILMVLVLAFTIIIIVYTFSESIQSNQSFLQQSKTHKNVSIGEEQYFLKKDNIRQNQVRGPKKIIKEQLFMDTNKNIQNLDDKSQGIQNIQQPNAVIDQQKQLSQSIYLNKALDLYKIKRRLNFQQIISSVKKSDQVQLKNHLEWPYNISISQYMRALTLMQYSPLIQKQDGKISQIMKQQQNYYQDKFNISHYQQLPICVVVPTFQNFKRYRFYYNLQTILQQQYQNYHVVIVDDASLDKTAHLIQYEIEYNAKFRGKVTLVKNKQRQYHMSNFYKAIYGHCKKGQILITIDGDDELIGRFVFKTINAAYHRSKSLVIYTNHLQSKRQVAFDIGMSRSYSEQTKKNNTYRYQGHYYSHLRSTWTDLFFLVKQAAFKDKNGVWFNSAVDNAIFYPIMQMSCGQVEYLNQITYKYNTYTGNNVENMPYSYRKQMSDQIKAKQRYKCLKQWDLNSYITIKSYMK